MGARELPRRIVVTGVGSGIGRAIAEHLARAGDHVIGTVRSPERAAGMTAGARNAGLPLEVRALELTSSDQIEAFGASLDSDGGLDVLVHNAGFGVFGPLEDVDAAASQRQLAVNLLGPLALTRRLLPHLRERRGRIVWIGSLAGRLALPFQSHYSATKAAIASISDAMRIELAPLGVAVSCVEPGDFATGFTDARQVSGATNGAYRARLESCLSTVQRQEREGADPRLVALAVERLCRMRGPPARYPVGRWARTLCLLHRLLPDALREALVRRAYRV